MSDKIFGKSHILKKELQFYLSSIVEQKYITAKDIYEAGLSAEDSLTYYN
jgi:hypothetical protein